VAHQGISYFYFIRSIEILKRRRKHLKRGFHFKIIVNIELGTINFETFDEIKNILNINVHNHFF
jgi:hypothetical protein